MSKLSKDNRDNEAMEECYVAEIQALRKRVKELEDMAKTYLDIIADLTDDGR